MVPGTEETIDKLSRAESLRKNHAVYWSSQEARLYIALQGEKYRSLRLAFKDLYHPNKSKLKTKSKSKINKKEYQSYQTEKYFMVRGLTKEKFDQLNFEKKIEEKDWISSNKLDCIPSKKLKHKKNYTDLIRENKQPYWDATHELLFIIREENENHRSLTRTLNKLPRTIQSKKKISCRQSLGNRIVITGLTGEEVTKIFHQIPLIAEQQWVNEALQKLRVSFLTKHTPYTDGVTPRSVYVILSNENKEVNSSEASSIDQYVKRSLEPLGVIKKRKTHDDKIYLFLFNISPDIINNQFGTSATVLPLPEDMKIDLSAAYMLFPEAPQIIPDITTTPSALQSGTSMFGSWGDEPGHSDHGEQDGFNKHHQLDFS